MKHHILVLVLSVIAGCNTNPPNAPPPPDTGRVFVTASVDSAAIYLDDRSTGKIAPDTIVATVGEHVIRLERKGYFPTSRVVQVRKDSLLRAQFTLSAESGRIYVVANTPGCLIVLDGASTGKVTPDTIRTSLGSHLLRLEKPMFQSAARTVQVFKDSTTQQLLVLQTGLPRTALVEDFSNVSCQPCVASNILLERLTNQTYGRAKLVAIKYPTNFPSPNDPFYRSNPTDADARIGYYTIFLAPTMLVDGQTRFITADSVGMKNSIDARLRLAPRFWIATTSEVVGSVYTTRVRVWALDTAGLDFSQLVLQTVVTEAEIEFTTPPGSNGETRFYDVMRAMLPVNSGTPISPGIQPVEYQRQLTIGSSWNATRLRTVAFIQHRQTKEILQTGSTF